MDSPLLLWLCNFSAGTGRFTSDGNEQQLEVIFGYCLFQFFEFPRIICQIFSCNAGKKKTVNPNPFFFLGKFQSQDSFGSISSSTTLPRIKLLNF